METKSIGKQDQNCQEQFRARLWCEERGPELSSWPSVAECFTARPSSCGCTCWCCARGGQPFPFLIYPFGLPMAGLLGPPLPHLPWLHKTR